MSQQETRAVAANQHNFESTYAAHFAEHVWKDALYGVLHGLDHPMTASDKAHIDANADHAKFTARRTMLGSAAQRPQNVLMSNVGLDTDKAAELLDVERVGADVAIRHRPLRHSVKGRVQQTELDQERAQGRRPETEQAKATVVGITPSTTIGLDHPLLHVLDATELKLVSARSKVKTIAV